MSAPSRPRAGRSSGPERGAAFVRALALSLVLSPVAAPAAFVPLDDAQLAGVNARGPAPTDLLSGWTPGIDTRVSVLDAQAFAADLSDHGLPPFGAPFYDGRAVVRMQFDGPPVDLQVDLSQLLVPLADVAQHVSLGTVRLQQVSLTGTTFWIWSH